MCNLKCTLIVLLYLIQSEFIGADEPKTVKYSAVQQWAEKFGIELWNLGDYITRRQDVVESFKQSQIVSRSGSKIVEDIAKEIKFMMDARISAVRRVVDTAQEIGSIAAGSDEIVEKNFTYFNAKEMVEPSEVPATESPNFMDSDESDNMEMPKPVIVLTESEKFGDFVNLSISSVHVPANVYDRAKEVIKAIKWSEMLDNIFDSNYKHDPSLFWQYFCSSAGFLRQFPATKWKMDPVDLYDCRLRSWYIQAANSPKDIVILVDNSGSMTGQRRDVARHVVESILDTLTSNDFVNIFTFSDELKEVVECFGDQLVQANMANVRELKQALNSIETSELANFTAAFNKAFEILAEYRSSNAGACCNQAIMLISDGVPYPIDEVFEAWNWQEKPFIPVRVFTYLIGREVADITDIKRVACENLGYYVHLSTFAEVREEVIQYIPVVARPLVLNRTHHPVVFSQLYADVVDPQMTDYEWECRERAKQRERFMVYRKSKNFYNLPEDPSNLGYDFIEDDDNERMKKFNFMTTVSIPVYDKRENMTRIANLLGVAAADIPVSDIKKLMQPFLLGVGGYAFICDNNGFLLIHPDFRPVFYKDILKPAYNAVDMIEVELMDDDHEPRDFNEDLIKLRELIIDQSIGSRFIHQKYHFDRMRRASRMKRHYFWTELKDTPFTLVVSYPELYGQNRLQTRSEDEIHRVNAKGTNVLNFFSGSNWKIHPDWLYCKHVNDTFSSPEAELLYFLERMRQPGWRWPLNRSPPPPEHMNIYTNNTSGKFLSDKDSYYCDRNLVQSLVYDAKITEWYSRNASAGFTEKGNEFKQRFGVSISFVATHSGLLRWMDHSTMNEDVKPENEFSETNKKAIGEIWYRRAVEQHFVEPSSFVYAVPFDPEFRNDTLVTATHAVFHKENGKSAPAAVVGFQFQHSAMHTLFKNITSTCGDKPCVSCITEGFECFVLDDNGYVIVSPDASDTGKFIGDVRGFLMHHMVNSQTPLFKKIIIYDYQAICFIGKDALNMANRFLTPLKYFWELLKIISNHLVWMFLSVLVENTRAYGAYTDGSESMVYYTDYNNPDPTDGVPPSKSKEQEFDRRVLINRTRPERCDKIITLYQVVKPKEKEKSIFDFQTLTSCERPYIVVPIPSSNMVLVVASTLCPLEPSHFPNQPIEKHYDNSSSLQCYKLKNAPTHRRQLKHCFNKHINESQIELCGKASKFYISFYILSLAILVAIKSLY